MIFGQKGEIEGDFRTDATEMLLFKPDGTVLRTEQTVKTWIKGDAIRAKLRHKYRAGTADGLTPDAIYRHIVAAYGNANA